VQQSHFKATAIRILIFF